MTGTGEDKSGEKSLLEAGPPQPAPVYRKSAEQILSRLFWLSPKTVRHVVIEVLIVTVGVLLALGIDQARQHFGRLAQADEARHLLRAEMRRNLEMVEGSLPRLAEAYRILEAEPEKAPSIYGRGRFGTPPVLSTAYDLALQTGALAYLQPEERGAITQVYRQVETFRDSSEKYADGIRLLAAYPTGTIDDRSLASARLLQTRFAAVLATSSFRAQCRLIVGVTNALEEPRITKGDGADYCGAITPSADVEAVIAGRYVPPANDAPPESEAPN